MGTRNNDGTVVTGFRPINQKAGAQSSDSSTFRRADIFFSYSHAQSEYATRLVNRMCWQGFDVWLDNLEIRPGENWQAEIDDAIEQCTVVLVLMSPEASASKYVQYEVGSALRQGRKIFTLLHSGKADAFASLAHIHHVDVTNGKLPPDVFYEELAKFALPTPPDQNDTFYYLDPRNMLVDQGLAVLRSPFVEVLIATLGFAFLIALGTPAVAQSPIFGGAVAALIILFFTYIRRAWIEWRLQQSFVIRKERGYVTHSRKDSQRICVGYQFISPQSGKEIRGESWLPIANQVGADLPPVDTPVKVAYANDRLHKLL
jgi:hypothetical protein